MTLDLTAPVSLGSALALLMVGVLLGLVLYPLAIALQDRAWRRSEVKRFIDRDVANVKRRAITRATVTPSNFGRRA